MPARVIVFDVNETLLDARALEGSFQPIFGSASARQEWLPQLLLHSETATLAGPYFDFTVGRRDARNVRGRARQAGCAAAFVARPGKALFPLTEAAVS